MLWNMGLQKYTIFNETENEKKINEIDKNFHLVMINEKMDESFVLLAHLLCLPLHEFAVFAKNVRKDEFKKMELSKKTKSVLRNVIDVAIACSIELNSFIF